MAVYGTPGFDRYVRLANMMIAFLREHGRDYDADICQQVLDGDGPGTAVEMASDSIVDFKLDPPRDMIVLFGRVHEEEPWCEEEYSRFRDYLREREGERVSQQS